MVKIIDFCDDCPFFQEMVFCNHPFQEMHYDETASEKFFGTCPLKTEPLTLKLKDGRINNE